MPGPERGRRLDLKVGYTCNNRCRFCVQGDKRDRLPDRTTAELIAALEAGRATCDGVVLTGGEVTIRPDALDLVRAARALGYRTVQLQTNGRMLASERFADAVAAAGVTEVSPAIHGPAAEVHDGLTRAPRSFLQAVRGVRHVRERGLDVIVNSVVVRANHRLLPAMARLFVALGVKQFQFAFVHALGEAEARFDEVVPLLSEVQPYVRRAVAIGRLAGVPVFTEGVPLCFLRGIEDAAAEAAIPATRIDEGARLVADWTARRRDEAKTHGPPCAACSAADRCEGPWREYPARFGWGEFRPLARRPSE